MKFDVGKWPVRGIPLVGDTLFLLPTAGLTTSYDESTGTLVILGKDSSAIYEDVLVNVRYANDQTEVTFAPRIIEVKCSGYSQQYGCDSHAQWITISPYWFDFKWK